jgi:hypothetical protein
LAPSNKVRKLPVARCISAVAAAHLKVNVEACSQFTACRERKIVGKDDRTVLEGPFLVFRQSFPMCLRLSGCEIDEEHEGIMKVKCRQRDKPQTV